MTRRVTPRDECSLNPASDHFVAVQIDTHSVDRFGIDGDHRYRAVRRDIDCWLRFLRPDATIIFHDAYNPRIGPFHAIAELVASGQWERHEAVDKAVVLRRKPPL
jgi:hypothetical protein